VSLAEIVRAAVEQMRPTFDHNHVQLTTAIEETPHPLLGDAVRLQQVFTNLLSNAAKFTPAGGHVGVELSSVGNTATVTIRDDGVGIGTEFLPHVFDGLRQDPRTADVNVRGLGLGLSIARHFVERHGGTIRASSDGPGKGATLTVVLPLQPQRPADEERPRPARVATRRYSSSKATTRGWIRMNSCRRSSRWRTCCAIVPSACTDVTCWRARTTAGSPSRHAASTADCLS